MVQDFIGNGANVNAKDQEHGHTGLHVASKYGHNPIIKCLIVNDARIDEKDNEDRTPLMSAANANHPLAIKTLLLSGANEKIKDKDDNTAFDKSTNKDVKDVLMPNSAFLQIVSAYRFLKKKFKSITNRMGLNSKIKDAVQKSMKVIRDLVQHENTELLLFTDAHDETLLHQVSKASPTLDDLNYLKEHVMQAFKEDFRPLVINIQIQVMEKNEKIEEAKKKNNSASKGSMPFNLNLADCDWAKARVIIAAHQDIFFGSIIDLLYCCILIANGYWRQALIILPLLVAGRESIRQCMPYDKSKKIFKVHNNTLKVLQIVPIKEIFQIPGNNMLSVCDDNSDKGNFSSFAYVKIAKKKKWLFNFRRSKYFLVELLDTAGAVVDSDVCTVPVRGTQEINLLANISREFREKINYLFLNEPYDGDDLLSSECLSVKELPEKYEHLYTPDTYKFLIKGSIDSRNWNVIKAHEFDSELHSLFQAIPDQKIYFCYVFTTQDDNIHKNFALAKSDGKQMKEEEIGEAASYIRRMYTGIYSNMEDLYADDNSTFLKKLNGKHDKLKSVYQIWRAREYKTNHWIYNPLDHVKFKELIFSSKMGSSLNGFFKCEFTEYKESSCVWPSASISKIEKSTLIIKEC